MEYFVYPFICEWTRGPFLTRVNNAAVSTGIEMFVGVPSFHFFGYLPRNGITGSQGSSV